MQFDVFGRAVGVDRASGRRPRLREFHDGVRLACVVYGVFCGHVFAGELVDVHCSSLAPAVQ